MCGRHARGFYRLDLRCSLLCLLARPAGYNESKKSGTAEKIHPQGRRKIIWVQESNKTQIAKLMPKDLMGRVWTQFFSTFSRSCSATSQLIFETLLLLLRITLFQCSLSPITPLRLLRLPPRRLPAAAALALARSK